MEGGIVVVLQLVRVGLAGKVEDGWWHVDPLLCLEILAVDIPCHKALYFLHEFGLLAYTVPHFHGESHDETNKDDNNNKKNKNKNNGNKHKRKPSGGIGNEKADCWKYFDPKMERPDGPNGPLVKMAHCKFCTKVYRADSVKNGTKNMNLHYPNCDGNPMNAERLKQKKLNFMKDNNRDGEGCSTGTLQNWKYDEKAIKSSLIELIVLAELPFKFVEHPTFIKYSKNLQPKYNLPSRHTISRDVAKFYLEEKEKLVKFLGNPNHTIHLTTDTWTSTCQKINYMVITAHFIDDDWVMHKRVINFKRINSHRGEDIGRVHPNEVETIGSRLRFLIAECPTRWNSTYDMLKSAIDLQDAFYNYSMKNASFSRDLNAIPRRIDFDVCQKVCDFLEKFKEKMELVSTQSSHVAHLFYSEILDIDKHLHEWEFVPKHLMENGCIPEENEDEVDTPMEFLTDNEKEEKVKELVYEVETNMGVLFALYNEKYGTKLTNNSSDVQKSSSTQSSNTTRRREPILELDDEEDFDILSWWKLNSPRFPIVSKMAKILVNLHYHQALLCTQSWVRTSQKNIYMDDLEDLMKDEEVIKEMKEALDKLKGANGKDATVTMTVTDATEVATVAVMLLKWVLESRDVSGRSLVGIFKWVYREKNCEVFSVMSRWESCGSRRQKVVEKTAEDGRTSGSNRGGSDWDVKDVLSKLLQMGMVAEYQNSLEAKRSLDSNEEVKKAHTRVHGLEKQMEKLPIELQLDNNFREALETRGKQLVDIFALFVVVSVAMLRFQYKEVYKAIFNNNDNVDMLYDGQSWKWPKEWVSKYLVLMLKQDIKLEREIEDKTVWVDNKKREVKFSVSRAWK
ncbi:zinc finger BED domain-containing protein RICESLEEPER 2 [Tanacetum coccineum]